MKRLHMNKHMKYIINHYYVNYQNKLSTKSTCELSCELTNWVLFAKKHDVIESFRFDAKL